MLPCASSQNRKQKDGRASVLFLERWIGIGHWILTRFRSIRFHLAIDEANEVVAIIFVVQDLHARTSASCPWLTKYTDDLRLSHARVNAAHSVTDCGAGSENDCECEK